mgnify:CR=1 FL=1
MEQRLGQPPQLIRELTVLMAAPEAATTDILPAQPRVRYSVPRYVPGHNRQRYEQSLMLYSQSISSV